MWNNSEAYSVNTVSEKSSTQGFTGTGNANFRVASMAVSDYVADAGSLRYPCVLRTAPVASKRLTNLAMSLELGRLDDSMPHLPRNRQDRDYDLSR